MNLEKTEGVLSTTAKPDKVLVDEILSRAMGLNGLSHEDVSLLLNIEEEEMLHELCQAAGEIKELTMGKRISFFAPLYLSNDCTNNCLYCGFRRDNKSAVRVTLKEEDIIAEARFLQDQGFKHLLLVTGEDRGKNGVQYLSSAVRAILKHTEFRRININAPPMTIDEMRRLRGSGADLYQSFQETYHKETYAVMHPSGRKRDYVWRVGVIERAIEAGFSKVGMGTLLGLYDYRFEVLALLAHAALLRSRYGITPAALSVPRLRPAPDALLDKPPYPVSDSAFKKIVAIYRLALPYTDLTISTRESEKMRDEVIHTGASVLSAGSRTEPGGYTRSVSTGQFEIEDKRPLDVMEKVIRAAGLIPDL
ncbi:MAG: [FeFe] hydrogenase H-cluster radical SAM maturase HydG [Nitrospirae bacterium]|nr:[FeFe] hydrogenase H-cluster radical SAM maturase HydG [Nitrospirota bacterium]